MFPFCLYHVYRLGILVVQFCFSFCVCSYVHVMIAGRICLWDCSNILLNQSSQASPGTFFSETQISQSCLVSGLINSEMYWFTQKYSVLTWIAVHDRLATGVRVQKWSPNSDAHCVLCTGHIETREHLFFCCPYS